MTKTRTFVLIAVLIMASLVSIGLLIPTDYKPKDTVNKRYEIHQPDPFLNNTMLPNSNVLPNSIRFLK